jgi:cystathionine beta-synthase
MKNWETTKSNVLEAIGYTPLVRLNRVGSEYPVEIYAKLEYMNPGGSVKDRIAWAMVCDAEKRGLIKPGDTLIEPTSGNTGIGLAMVCAIRGYKLIICMPEKMSMEKQLTMEALGATIVRTPTTAAHDDPESNFGVAKRLQQEIPNSHILNQFWNDSNPLCHYSTTGCEILQQMENKVDYIVAAIGTGGTISGIAKKVKEELPTCQIVAADPEGSIMGGGDYIAPYQVEGIGYDFVPGTYHHQLVDRVVKTNDATTFELALRLIRDEGMLVGGSSGAAMQAALEVASTAPEGSRIVVIFADSIRNYMNKHLSPEWRREHGFNF